ncbi:MAG: hypothetical protein ACYTG0_42440 [Planctomycetota bacterium]
MSVLQKSLEKAQLELVADALPKKDRTVKTFQRLIAAIRATEAEVVDRIHNSETEKNECLRKLLQLQERNHRLESALKLSRVRERLNSMERLTSADKQQLLEVSSEAVNSDGA